MADEIRLVTFEGQNVAPINDALMWETAIGDSGVIYGCETTLKDASTLHIETGYGVVCGRHFQIFESDIPVTLSPGGDLLGRLYVHMDLSDASEPIQLLVETAASLTPVEQDDNVNITNGVWEFNLATFDLNALTISNLVNVFPTVAGGGANLIAGIESGPNASEAYVAGQYIIWASRLWEVIDAIAVGDQFVIGSNLSATNTTVGSELTKLNDSLSDKLDKNPTPDISYTTTSNMTGGQVLNWLWDNVDRSKLTINSIIHLGSEIYRIANVYFVNGVVPQLRYMTAGFGPSKSGVVCFVKATADGGWWSSSNGDNYISTVMIGANAQIDIFY